MRRPDEKEWKCPKFLRIVQLEPCILQTRIESLKPFIVSGMWWSVKLVLSKWNAKIVLLRASMFVTYCIKLFRQTYRYLNVSTLSSRRDNYHWFLYRNIATLMNWVVFVVWLTDERLLTLFPERIIVRDPLHLKSTARGEQNLNLWVQA